MADDVIETAASEQETPASTSAPAIPTPQPTLEELKAAAKEEARRELQAGNDRAQARLHQQYQQREKVLLEKVKGTLKTAGYEDADRLEQQLAAESDLDEFRAMKGQMAAQQASFSYGEGLIRDIADNYEVKLAANDPRLWGEPFDNWDQFKERVRAVAKQEVAAKRAAEKAVQEAERRDAVDARVTSGELATLGGVPAGAVKKDELSGYKPKDAADLYRLGASREGARQRK